jgi:hypothetical protein
LSQNFAVRAEKLKRVSDVQYSNLNILNNTVSGVVYNNNSIKKNSTIRKLFVTDALNMYNIKFDNKKKN